MLLFPFRAQIKLHKWPVMTIAVAVLCLVIYAAQWQSDRRVEAQAERVCAEFAAGGEGAGQDYKFGRWTIRCKDILRHIHYDPRPEEHLAWHLDDFERTGDPASAERLRAQYRAFAARAPVPLTARLWHDRARFDPVGMITSTFAHGDWEHVIFNVIPWVPAFAGTTKSCASVGEIQPGDDAVQLPLRAGFLLTVLSHVQPLYPGPVFTCMTV